MKLIILYILMAMMIIGIICIGVGAMWTIWFDGIGIQIFLTGIVLLILGELGRQRV